MACRTRLAGSPHRRKSRGQRERTGIERLADHRALDAQAVQTGEGTKVVEAAHSPARHDGPVGGSADVAQQVEVRAGQRAVSADVGHDVTGTTIGVQPRQHVEQFAALLGPSARSECGAAHVEPHRDPLTVPGDGVAYPVRSLQGCGADVDPSRAGGEGGLQRLVVADAPGELNGHVKLADHRAQQLGIAPPTERRVEVHEVDPPRAIDLPLQGRVERIAVRRLGAGPALNETHRQAVGNVDGRQQLEPGHDANGIRHHPHTPTVDTIDDLADEQDRLESLLAPLTTDQWSSPSAAAGWSIADVVLHLAQTEEAVALSIANATRPDLWERGDRALDDSVADAVAAERAPGEEIFARWKAARRQALVALQEADPEQRVPWAATPLKPRVLATTRLAEHWAHGLDITDALGLPFPDTARLRHVAWLGHRTLPYAFEIAGLPSYDVYCELTGPDGEALHYGPPDAESLVRGAVGEFCRVGARRLAPEQTALVAEGPHAADALRVLRNYAA